jgi:hypothetical protein
MNKTDPIIKAPHFLDDILEVICLFVQLLFHCILNDRGSLKYDVRCF